MNNIKRILDSIAFYSSYSMVGFNEAYDVVYSKGYILDDIELIKQKLMELSSKKEIILHVSDDIVCKVNEITIDTELLYVCMGTQPFLDGQYDDPFIQENGKFFDGLNSDIVVMKNKQVIFRNKKVLELLGLKEDESMSSHLKFQTQSSLEVFNNFLDTKSNGELILEIISKDDKVHLAKTAISCIKYNGEYYHISIVKDVTQIKEIEEKYIAEIDYLRYSIKAIDEGVIVVSSNNIITMFNKAASDLSGISPIDAFDKNVTDVIKILDKDKRTISYIDEDKLKIKDSYLDRDDGMLWNIAFSIDSVYNDDKMFLGKVITIVDISEIKRREKEILYLSYHDVLTGLYNRSYLEETIQRLDTPRQVPFSVIMGDVNGLKMTNDVFGHDEGDNLLRNVSKILKNISRSEDIVGRWGGDEFVILLPKTSEEEVHMITKRIIRAFEDIDDSYNIQGIVPSISLGYGVKKTFETDIFETLKIAESNMYKRKMLTKDSVHNSVIVSMKTALYEKSHETEEHTNRLYSTCLKVAKHYDLNSDEFSDLELLCMLHDVGKIGIPDGILKYQGPLNETQWEEMKRHTEVGYRIALATPGLKKVANYILSHHEHYDGSGYPKGLSGDKIPLLNRIMSVADSFDAMTNDRVYKKAMSKEEAFLELKNCSGSQFDPKIVDLFISENSEI